ncbi:MAG TPA: EscU/YscU/HrcU family type III secretion system export apparatus switch protein [Phycisphaerae bacterium]|nr:EscU/YscU/HrcU family type III secretion system export apparatus switch protein [Phycisphaerae bacterium]
MAEDDNKTEPATARRRQEARDSGQIARSQDLTAAVLLIVGLLTLSKTGNTFVGSLKTVMEYLLGSHVSGNARDMFEDDLRANGPHVIRCLWPIMLAVAGAAFVAVGAQVGFHFNTGRLTPNLARLNPLQGLGRLFAGRNAMQMTMNLAKTTVLAVTAWMFVQSQMPVILTLGGLDFPQNFAVGAQIIYDLAWRLAWALFILALSDWLYQKWRFERDIRMSKQEVKEEAKRMDGDQEIKGRRRQMARKMIMQRIHRDVPKADVVITNPTELAIALKYDSESMGAPRVVAKGAGFLAARIRQLAVQNGVPIVERKPLAQALYKTVDVGQEVPAEFYAAIAEILAYVYELSGKGLRRARELAGA